MGIRVGSGVVFWDEGDRGGVWSIYWIYRAHAFTMLRFGSKWPFIEASHPPYATYQWHNAIPCCAYFGLLAIRSPQVLLLHASDWPSCCAVTLHKDQGSAPTAMRLVIAKALVSLKVSVFGKPKSDFLMHYGLPTHGEGPGVSLARSRSSGTPPKISLCSSKILTLLSATLFSLCRGVDGVLPFAHNTYRHRRGSC